MNKSVVCLPLNKAPWRGEKSLGRRGLRRLTKILICNIFVMGSIKPKGSEVACFRGVIYFRDEADNGLHQELGIVQVEKVEFNSLCRRSLVCSHFF